MTEYGIQNTEYRIRNTEYRIHKSLLNSVFSILNSVIFAVEESLRYLRHLRRFAIRVDELERSQVQLTNSRLDLRPISDDHPHQLVGLNRLLRCRAQVGDLELPHFRREGHVVVVRQIEAHDFLDRAAERADCLPL